MDLRDIEDWEGLVDWTGCAEVERIPGKVSGAPILKDSRVFADSIIDNYACAESAESIAAMFRVLLEQVQAVLNYALFKLGSSHDGCVRSQRPIPTE
jgi:uncharacterized protein (DUF433 family)